MGDGKVGWEVLCGCLGVGIDGACGVDVGGSRQLNNRMGGIMGGRGCLTRAWGRMRMGDGK